MGAALFGMLLIEYAPFHKVVARILGPLAIVWVCYERAVLGYHTIGQVTTGAAIGIALHFYSTSVPQLFVLVDDVVMLVAGLPIMFADQAVRNSPPGDMSTLCCASSCARARFFCGATQ